MFFFLSCFSLYLDEEKLGESTTRSSNHLEGKQTFFRDIITFNNVTFVATIFLIEGVPRLEDSKYL